MKIVPNIPSSLFAMPLHIGGESPDSAAIPRHLLSIFDLREAQLGGSDQGRFVAAIAKERPTVIESRNLVTALSAVSSMPVVVCWDGIDAGMKRIFASEGISYIKDGDNALLPFIGAAIAPERYVAEPERLSPQAQRVLFSVLGGAWNACNASEIARKIGKSNASVTKYLSEIEAVASAMVTTSGKSRILAMPERVGPEVILEAFDPYLSSPVVRIHRIAEPIDTVLLERAGARLSGESALAVLTDLAFDPSHITVQMDGDDIATLAEEMGPSWREASWYEAAPLTIEEWAYPPIPGADRSVEKEGLSCVDSLSLYASVKGKHPDDVRFCDAVEQLKEEICRGF
ncbi:hypothetical protein [uncultured Adlercreutzia sp.]|uniref:hypothetical protein n=1 Tax=uncultured Adlercreutzia sp. TaxID=875803 RepID=UPI0026F3B177|nr:hypothetical protein [uncultured Adlercreutzia sp.]